MAIPDTRILYDRLNEPIDDRASSVAMQQAIMKELSGGSHDAEADIQALAGAPNNSSLPLCRGIDS